MQKKRYAQKPKKDKVKNYADYIEELYVKKEIDKKRKDEILKLNRSKIIKKYAG